MTVLLSLFGAPSIALAGTTRALTFERRAQLLVYLAMKRTWVGRAEIAALLWPAQDTKLAFTNLRKTLHRLQPLPEAQGLEIQGSALRYDVETDVDAFEVALREQRFADAIALRRGHLLLGFDDDANDAWSGWLRFERDRLHTAWRAAAQLHLAGDVDPGGAIDLAARLLEADPLDDDALRQYMRWLGRSGQAARAKQAYREFVTRLADELGLAPSAELTALHDSIGNPAPTAAAGIAALRPGSGEGFVGRTIELRRVASLLAQNDCRLLTVTGPGGVGKTRLAQRALRECAPSFRDGAAFVPLEDLVAAAELGARLARELDLALKGQGDPLDQVIDALRGRNVLLVLDNFEQFAADAPRLEHVLAACPRVKILVTSRVRLGLASEWLLPLAGMPVPEPEDVDELESFDAVRVFVNAAHRVAPALNPAVEGAAIVEICRRVEGLPLALELAAAWTRLLSCKDIAAELERGAELLHAADAAGRPARHASIEAVFEQSWRLLGDRERQALARLAVFRGGFRPEAARAVAGVALPVLAALVDKSLLRKEGARCFLHPLVQQSAQAKLEQGVDAASTAAAHGRHFLRHLAEVRDRVSHADSEALRELDADYENIRAAWRFATQHGLADDLVRGAYSLMSYSDHRGRRLEGLELMRQAMAAEDAADDPKLAPALAAPAAWLAYRLDRYAEAEALGKKALAAGGSGGERNGDATLAFQAATVLGATCFRVGRPDDARRWFERALELAKRAGNPNNIAGTLDNLGLVARGVGDLDEALRLYRQALLTHREVGDAGGEAICLNNLGVVHILRGEVDAARTVLREARELSERHGLPSTRSMIEVNLANVAMKSGAAELAATHARRALELAEQTGQRATAVEARHALVAAALRRGDLDAARAELAAALSVSIEIGRRALLVHGVRLFADVLAAQDAIEAAARVLAFALQQPAMVGAEREEALRQLQAWGAPSTQDEDWTGPALDELAQRVVVETSQTYALLIAELRAARQATDVSSGSAA
jgi:predicted ATPase/DNA-binding SARP family transcriptional activator